MSEQTVRLVFLGEAGQAIAAQDAVLVGTKRLTVAQREQAAATRAVRGETAVASRGMQQLDRDIGKSARGALAGSGAFRGLGRSIAFASASFLGGFGLTFAIRAAVDELHKAAAANAQVDQALRTTQSAAGVTARQIDRLSLSLLRKTGYDDEAVKSAATLLLSFTEIRNEVGKGNDIYTQAVKLSVDLARRLGEDLPGAAKQLGRALNDPVRGLTTLSRAGIQFTKVQREQIAALVESGHILDAQKIILENVATKVGGAAAAYGRTPAGQLDIFRESLRNLAATYASAFTPEIAKATKGAQAWVDRLEKDPAARKNFQHDIEDAAGALGDIASTLHTAADAVGGFGNVLRILVGMKVLRWAGEFAASMSKIVGTAGAAGAAGEGAGALGASFAVRGLLTQLGRLAAYRVIPITIALKVLDDATGHAITNWLFHDERNPVVFLANQLNRLLGLPSLTGGGTATPVAPVLAGKQFKSSSQQFKAAGAGSLAFVPAGSGATVGGSHPTSNLPGFPAHDIFVKPGTPVLAPEDGALTRITGQDPATGSHGAAGVLGYSLYFVGDSGTTYFMTHLAQVAPEGRYAKGQEIGTVAYHPRGSHVHVGVHEGSSTFAYAASTQKPTLGRGSTPRRPPRGPVAGATDIPLNLQEALAQAGTTTGKKDDRSALQAIISFLVGRLKQGGLAQTQRISLLQQEGSYLDQLAGLDTKGKKPSQVSKSSLIVIKNTLAEVGKLVDQASLDKKFEPQLAKINDLLDKKIVTPETLARVRIQLGKIADAAKAAIDKAKQQLEARRQAFSDAWTQLASDAFTAFDKETASHVGPTRAILNALMSEHDKAAIDQAVTDAKKALDDALAGQNTNTDTDILSQVRQLVGKAALANAIDKAQSTILGISPQEVSSSGLIRDLQSLLAPGGGQAVDPEAVKQAQKAYDDAVYQQKLFDLGKQADLEDDQYAQARNALREALQLNLDAWATYYRTIGENARSAAGDFASVWASVLGQFPIAAGGSINTGNASTASKQLSPGFNIPAGVIGAGFGGAFAAGGEGVVAKPTLFLAGESGPERYQFSPLRGGSGGTGTGQTAHTVIHLTGEPLDSLIRSQIIEATPEISIAIGKEASLRARSGRY